MSKFIVHAVREGLETSSVILNVPSKHQGRRTRFSLTDKYKNEHGAPIMVAQATVISANPIRKRAVEKDAEIGDIVYWVAGSNSEAVRYRIVDDRRMHNPYLVPADKEEKKNEDE